MNNESQNYQLLEYLKNHKGCTKLEVQMALGIGNVGGRIFDLRKRGIKIDRKMISVTKANGKTAIVAYYSLARN